MAGQRNKACGVDVHRDNLVATILSRDGMKIQRQFGTTISELFEFRNWLIDNDCRVAALESTGTYWIPVYTVLEDSVEVILANPYMIKHVPGKKTDATDSDWIAELCLNELIAPSRIFPREDRDIRMLTRTRESLVKIRTSLKNKIHRDLASANIKLSSVITDIFGKSGLHCLMSKLLCMDVEEIIRTIPSGRVRKKANQIREALEANLDQVHVLSIKISLHLLENINQKIEEVDNEIRFRILRRQKDLEIAMSVPGVNFVAGVTILAEIGEYRDFSSPEKLASYFGMVPYVYQSAGKLNTGGITKHGSSHLRWILIQVAHAASRKKGSKLRQFYLRVRARRGANVAIVALARKILCILHHLLMNQELYEEKGIKSSITSKLSIRTSSANRMTLEEMIGVIRQSGYVVNKVDRGAWV